jgi:secreted trypsin-like serine protease
MNRLAIPLALSLALLPAAAAADAPQALERFLAEGRDLTNAVARALLRVLERMTAAQRRALLVAIGRDPRIVGGQAVTIADHPWQVALIRGYMSSRSQFCGGSLIAPNVVVTAAHCIVNPIVQNNPARVDIVAGTEIFSEGGERLDVDAIFVHPQYNPANNDFDVAIVTLTAPSTLGRPVALDPQPVTQPVQAWVTGWGALSEGGLGTPDLLGVELPIVDTAACNQAASYNGDITDQMICAGLREGGKDSCQGDSGGPLTVGRGPTARLVGIVSWGEGCARRLKYGVYTRVSSVAPWIQSFLAR